MLRVQQWDGRVAAKSLISLAIRQWCVACGRGGPLASIRPRSTGRFDPGAEVRHAVRAWRQWALSSFYWGNLWRALISGEAKRWRVRQDDVDLIYSYLRKTDLSRLEDLYYLQPVHRLSGDVIAEIETDSFAKGIEKEPRIESETYSEHIRNAVM